MWKPTRSTNTGIVSPNTTAMTNLSFGRTIISVAPSQPREPIQDPPNPQYPFQQTVTDFYDLAGNSYIVYADRYTGWVETVLMPNGKAKTVM